MLNAKLNVKLLFTFVWAYLFGEFIVESMKLKKCHQMYSSLAKYALWNCVLCGIHLCTQNGRYDGREENQASHPDTYYNVCSSLALGGTYMQWLH